MLKLKIGRVELDLKTNTAKMNGRKISLTPKEFELLYFLMSNQGKVLSRKTILTKIWQYPSESGSRVVDVYIGYLRKKIDHRQSKKLIHSVRGFGYTLKQ